MIINMGRNWIRHSHFFDQDDFECPVCGKRFNDMYDSCPACGNAISGEYPDIQDDWIEEAEELDWLLDDDD